PALTDRAGGGSLGHGHLLVMSGVIRAAGVCSTARPTFVYAACLFSLPSLLSSAPPRSLVRPADFARGGWNTPAEGLRGCVHRAELSKSSLPTTPSLYYNCSISQSQ